jgi:hypothetical protein
VVVAAAASCLATRSCTKAFDGDIEEPASSKQLKKV